MTESRIDEKNAQAKHPRTSKQIDKQVSPENVGRFDKYSERKIDLCNLPQSGSGAYTYSLIKI